MKTMLPIIIAVLFLFAPAFPYIEGLFPDQKDIPEVPFHTPAYKEGKVLPRYITENTTLGPEDGIVLINTIITVRPDKSLVMKPGTTVAVAEYGGIKVLGNLEAKGTEKNPITFISNELNVTNRNWDGIFYEATGSGAIEHAVFHHASPAISCSVPGKVMINNNKYLFGNLEVYGPC
jgi:hypothetical protein